MKLQNMFKKNRKSYIPLKSERPEVPEGLLKKCNKCGAAILTEEVKSAGYICPKCQGYFRVHAYERIRMTVDEDSFEEWEKDMEFVNPLEFKGYEEKVKSLKEKTGLSEAVVTGKASIEGNPAVIAVCDGRFLMASMGQVVGEKITRAVERATKEQLPVIIFACSGGARMQEGMKKNKAKGVAVNGVPIKKASELFGILNIVFFSPEDLNIIKSGPAERRRFLDSELCQLDRIYLADLTNYNKILAQRNKLLKDMIYRPGLSDTLPVWDMQLIETGKKIIRRRKQFVDELREIVSDIHYRISGGKEELFLKYDPNIDDIFFEDELSRAKEKDKKLCQTSVGPHRDDLLFSIGDVDIRKYGSQGQQRTSALSLKLSEIELVRKSISDTPVLLLDDVLSELDSSRQNYLLNNISDTQTIITCTGLDEFVRNRFTVNRVFEVIAGHVYERSI